MCIAIVFYFFYVGVAGLRGNRGNRPVRGAAERPCRRSSGLSRQVARRGGFGSLPRAWISLNHVRTSVCIMEDTK